MSKKIEKFEDLNVWKGSMRLSVNTYNAFEQCKDFGLRDQMQRASQILQKVLNESLTKNILDFYLFPKLLVVN